MSGPIPDSEPAATRHPAQAQAQAQAQALQHDNTKMTVPFPPQTPVTHQHHHHPSAAHAHAGPAARPDDNTNTNNTNNDHDPAAMDIDPPTPRAAAAPQINDTDQIMHLASANHNGTAAFDDQADDTGNPDDQEIPIFLSTPVQTEESGDLIERIQEENSRLRQQITRSYRQFEDLKTLRTTEFEAALRDHREIANARYEVSEARRLELEQLKSVYESRILDLERELSHFRTGGAPQPPPPTTASSSSSSAAAPSAAPPAPPAPEADPSALALLKISEHLTGLYLQMGRPGVINCAQYPSDVPDGMDPDALTYAFQLIELPPSAAAASAAAAAGGSVQEDEDAEPQVRYRYKPVRVPDHMADLFKVETEVEQQLLGRLYSRLLQDLVPADE